MSTIQERAEKTAIETFFSDTNGITAIADLTEDAVAWEPFENWAFSDLISQVQDTAEVLEKEFRAVLEDSDSYEHDADAIVRVEFGADTYDGDEDIDELVQDYADSWSMDMNDVREMVKSAVRSARRPA